MARASRLLVHVLLALLLLVALAVLAGWIVLRASLPRLDGELALPGLSAPVQVQRDALGVVTVDAANEVDAARALGWIHGQERFFEMDLLRRSAAGELSELFGAIAIDRDKAVRTHRLRARIEARYGAIVDAHGRAVLDAYTAGVNAGRVALGARPWAYLLLRAQPRDWRAEDSLLAGDAMFFDLQDEEDSREYALWRIRGAVPPALYRLIAADGTEWDAPLVGAPRGNITLPGAATLDLRRLPMPAPGADPGEPEPAAPGSNNFAVSGALTADGRAIVADDMHLALRAPNLWFRARLRYADAAAPGGRVDVAGFTLPGIPAVIVGSNTHVAWGFTNAYGDFADLYRVQWTDKAHTRYRSPLGVQPVVVARERILVKGQQPVTLAVRDTLWGPVTRENGAGESLALRWSAQQAGSINLGLSQLARAGNVDAALAAAGGIGMPAQNLVVADSGGRIAWRLTGQLPNRTGDCDPTAPIDPFACNWQGWRPAGASPRLVDPPAGRLWTANARTLEGAALATVGDAGYANGARARQIRDDLFAASRFDERALMAIQTDDRALFLARWWTLLRDTAQGSRDPTWIAFEQATRHWEGRAAPDAVSYRLVREWRLAVLERIKRGLMAPAMARLGKDFSMPALPQLEGVAWQLVTQRPANLLPRGTASWDALLLDAARDVRGKLEATGPLSRRTWGERNTAAICHPLARALPGLLKPLLCMPADPLAGDVDMPRVVAPAFGASERMVVSPGHEDQGLIHMPGGQSGHLLSPFWGAGHGDWVQGRPAPFLPGPATHTLSMRPR
jgi:penicillin amidase